MFLANKLSWHLAPVFKQEQKIEVGHFQWKWPKTFWHSQKIFILYFASHTLGIIFVDQPTK